MEQRDEVSLFDLWDIIAEQKKVVFLAFIVCVCVGLAYALLAKPVYKAEAFLLPPDQKDVQGLNVQGLNAQGYDSETVYEIAVNNLKSVGLRRKYFDEHKLAEHLVPDHSKDTNFDKVFDEKFNKKLIIVEQKKIFVTVNFEGHDARLSSEWVNGFIALVEKQTVTDLVSNIIHRIKLNKQSTQEKIEGKRKLAKQRRLDEIEQLAEKDNIARGMLIRNIDALREKAKQRRSDKTVQLEEAYQVADALKIVDPYNKSISNRSTKTASSVSVTTAKQPLYFLGTEAIAAQMAALKGREQDDPFTGELRNLQEKLVLLKGNSRVKVLRQRKNDDPFIAGLRDLEEHLARLDNIRIDKSTIHAVRLDQMALVPESPIKPKKALIFALSCLLGLMLGVCAAFIRNTVRRG